MSSTDETKRQWSRAMERRKHQTQQLKLEVVERILQATHAQEYLVGTEWTDQPGPTQVDALFHILFETASDSNHSLSLRRKSLDLIQSLRRQLDDASRLPENLLPTNGTTTTNSATTNTKTTTTSNAPATTTTTPVIAAARTTPPIPSIAPTNGAPKSVVVSNESTSSRTTTFRSMVPPTSTPQTFTTASTTPTIPKATAGGLPSSKTSTARFAAASAATTHLAASSVDDGDTPMAPFPLSHHSSLHPPFQNPSWQAHPPPPQSTLPPIDFAPPAYQRHSVVVAAAATQTHATTKKRSAPHQDQRNRSNSTVENGNTEALVEPPTQRQRTNSTTTNTTTHEPPIHPPTSTLPKPAGSTSSQTVPPPQPKGADHPVSHTVARPPPIQPVIQLDRRTENPPQATSCFVEFPADTVNARDSHSPWSGSRVTRPAVTLEFQKLWPGNQMLADAGIMLEQWEPFWKREYVVATGVTAVVRNLRWKKNPPPPRPSGTLFTNVPRTATCFEIPGFTGKALTKIGWGTSKIHADHGHKKPILGEMALVLWMLPITTDPKYKRANCHLWPKGTFLTVNKVPVVLNQRKQASHDATKWEQMSYPLDLSGHIRNPREKTSIALCCQDATQYLYVVAVCSYKPPLELLKELLHETSPFLCKKTLEESTEKAMGYINQHSMITIDDGDDGDDKGAMGKLVFSLVDPITKVPMKTPVRGQQCKHWQCFDLESFLTVNVPVSGGRWRCVCCESFVTYQELEVCGLTLEALKTFADEISATRDRVEFRADKSFRLLKELPLRHMNRHQRRKESGVPGANNNNNNNGASGLSSSVKAPAAAHQQEPIEIIDLDDD